MLILPWRNLKCFKCRSLKTWTFFFLSHHNFLSELPSHSFNSITLLLHQCRGFFSPLLHPAVGRKKKTVLILIRSSQLNSSSQFFCKIYHPNFKRKAVIFTSTPRVVFHLSTVQLQPQFSPFKNLQTLIVCRAESVAPEAVYPRICWDNCSVKPRAVSRVWLLCAAQDDVLILGNLLPWVSPGEELLTDTVSVGSHSARLPWT